MSKRLRARAIDPGTEVFRDGRWFTVSSVEHEDRRVYLNLAPALLTWILRPRQKVTVR